MSTPQQLRSTPFFAEEELAKAQRSLVDLEGRQQRLADGAAKASAEEKSLILQCSRLQKRLARASTLERSYADYAEEVEESVMTLQQLCISLGIDGASSTRRDLDVTSIEAGLGVRRAAVAWAETLRADVDEGQARVGRASANIADLHREVAALRQRLVYETSLGKSLRMVRERLAHFRDLALPTSLPTAVVGTRCDLEIAQARICELETSLDEKRMPVSREKVSKPKQSMEGAALIETLTSQVGSLRDHCAEAKREISRLHGELHLRHEALLAARRHHDGDSTQEGPPSSHTPSEYSSSFRGSDSAFHSHHHQRASTSMSTVRKDAARTPTSPPIGSLEQTQTESTSPTAVNMNESGSDCNFQ